VGKKIEFNFKIIYGIPASLFLLLNCGKMWMEKTYYDMINLVIKSKKTTKTKSGDMQKSEKFSSAGGDRNLFQGY